MRTQGSPEELFHRRQRAIALLEQGLTNPEVARRVGVHPRTVRHWHSAWRQGGEAALKPKPAPGAPARLSSPQKQELAQALVQGAKAAGLESELWTGRRVSQFIHQRFGVDYSRRYVLELLRALNFAPQRPEPVAQQKNEAVEARWRRWVWPAIKKNGPAPGRLARFPR